MLQSYINGSVGAAGEMKWWEGKRAPGAQKTKRGPMEPKNQ